MTKKTFYFGQALNGVRESYVQEGQEIRRLIAQHNNLVSLDFLGLGSHHFTRVYDHDRDNVMSADYGIFRTDIPTWGGGIEATLRATAGLPNLFLSGNLSGESKMLLGFADRMNIPVREYRSAMHAAELVGQWIRDELRV